MNAFAGVGCDGKRVEVYQRGCQVAPGDIKLDAGMRRRQPSKSLNQLRHVATIEDRPGEQNRISRRVNVYVSFHWWEVRPCLRRRRARGFYVRQTSQAERDDRDFGRVDLEQRLDFA